MKNNRAFAIIALLVGASAFIAVTAARRPAANSIDGNWIATFTLPGGQTIPGRMTFQATGEKLTGTIETEHTGPGKLEQGTWARRQLSATCVFENHENIAIAGELKDGKLSGTFRTEGMEGTWRAVRVGKPSAEDYPQRSGP